jgi:hypothetical protein
LVNPTTQPVPISVLLLFRIQHVVGLLGVASSIVKVANTVATSEQKGTVTFPDGTLSTHR